MGDHPNGLIVSHAQDVAAVEDGEEASFHLDRGVGGLIENAPLRRRTSETASCLSVWDRESVPPWRSW
jgi:hypothetical protein